jgi:hypothetical protein
MARRGSAAPRIESPAMGARFSRTRARTRPARDPLAAAMRPAGPDGDSDGDNDDGDSDSDADGGAHVHTWGCFRYFGLAGAPPGEPPLYRVHAARPYVLQEIAGGAWVPLAYNAQWTAASRRGVSGADARVVALTVAGGERAPPIPASAGARRPPRVAGAAAALRRAFGGRGRHVAFRGGGAAWEGNLRYTDPWLVILRPADAPPPPPAGGATAPAPNDRERCRIFGRATGPIELWGMSPYRAPLARTRATPPPAYC